jgi:hypothetical protein
VAEFTAKDVQALRQKTGAGMMDAKRAIEECDGDLEAAAKRLREMGLTSSAKRSDRANDQGAVAVGGDSEVMAIAEIKCETDFVAKSEQFTDLVQDLADLVAAKGEDEAKADVAERVDDLKVTTWLCTSPSSGRRTSPVTRSPRPRSPRSGPCWRPRPATRASPSRPSRRSSRASSRVASSPTGSCSTRSSSGTRARPSLPCSATPRSCVSPRW